MLARSNQFGDAPDSRTSLERLPPATKLTFECPKGDFDERLLMADYCPMRSTVTDPSPTVGPSEAQRRVSDVEPSLAALRHHDWDVPESPSPKFNDTSRASTIAG
jgi:hypothetical protein